MKSTNDARTNIFRVESVHLLFRNDCNFFNGTETILVLKKIAKFIVLFSQKFNLKKKFYYNQEIADGDYNKSLCNSVFFPIFLGKEFYWEII